MSARLFLAAYASLVLQPGLPRDFSPPWRPSLVVIEQALHTGYEQWLHFYVLAIAWFGHAPRVACLRQWPSERSQVVKVAFQLLPQELTPRILARLCWRW